jgi:uncharacterized membrane protein YoaK (UPF0700 family)
MSTQAKAPHRLAGSSIQSSDEARLQRWLAPLLSALAGTVDVIGFLSLKLFTAHVTGNLVVIAALLVRGGPPNVNQILAVPVFILAVGGVWLIAKVLDRRGVALARPLLLIQFLLLTCVLILSIAYDSGAHPHGLMPSIAAMIAVSAMACQFSLLRLAMPGAPSTAVMTGNLTKTVLSLLDTLSQRPVEDDARDQLRKTLQLIVPFFCGCLAGAALLSWLGDWAWSLPVVLAGAALTLAPSGPEQLNPGKEAL